MNKQTNKSNCSTTRDPVDDVFAALITVGLILLFSLNIYEEMRRRRMTLHCDVIFIF